MSRTLARVITALAMTGLATFGLAGVALAGTTCAYAGQAECLPATIEDNTLEPGETARGTAGPVKPNETGPIVLADTDDAAAEGAPRIQFRVASAGGDQTLAAGALASKVSLGRAAVADVNLGTYTADAAGIIHYAVKIPTTTPPGNYTLNFQGHLPTGEPVTYFVPLTVIGSTTGGGLPFTGAEIGIASALAVGLVGAGTMAVIASRRRRSAEAA